MNILAEIVEKLKPRLENRKRILPMEMLAEQAVKAPARPKFAAAFRTNELHVIAELKKASPSKGLIRNNFDVQSLAAELAENGATALSVLTEPYYFLGSEENLSIAAKTVSIPLLRKDFVFDEYQILEAKALGASCVLLIAAMLPAERFVQLLEYAHAQGLDVLGEAHTEDELETAMKADLVGVNARDLRTFGTSLERSAELIRTLPRNTISIAESAVSNHADMDMMAAAGAKGFLIGETLMRAEHPGLKLKELLSCC
ncbi:MAG: indole-3-glycerol phosphate synthase TrpC [Victivallales bacterium]|nr:indole-3-glycerol phosphate synthase TrpC [Victivallales bacterium]